MQSLTQHTQHDVQLHTVAADRSTACPFQVCRWLMAAGKRPVPFRTRKLSPPALMVLLPGGSGRVGYRRRLKLDMLWHPPPHRDGPVSGLVWSAGASACAGERPSIFTREPGTRADWDGYDPRRHNATPTRCGPSPGGGRRSQMQFAPRNDARCGVKPEYRTLNTTP